MITIYQPPAAWGLPSMSPFAVKLETYFRMTKIEYASKLGSFLKAPKGRVPYIKIDGTLLGDSNLIIETLKKRFGDPLDSHLTREQKATGLAMQRLMEDHLYFTVAWLRWSDEDSWKYVKDVLRPFMPPVIGGLILEKVRKHFLKGILDQGMGQHTRDEIIDFAKSDITAVSDFLGDKKYFLGDKPSTLDAVMYGFLIQQAWVPWNNAVKEHLTHVKNLIPYCERMKSQYWS